MGTTINSAAAAAATQNTTPTSTENKQSFFMRCVKSIKNCCCKPETLAVVGAVTVAVGAGLVIAGTVATGGALAAVGLAVGIAGVVIHAIRKDQSSCDSYDLGNTPTPENPDTPSAADAPAGRKEGPARETGYQEGTPQFVLEDSPEPERPRGLQPTISFTLDDMEDDGRPVLNL